ncbi:MAG: hypothetical protein ACR2MD_15090 [Aridibacter sp.]|jgi:outer membrane protein assembly factor BamD (BamD/ComL family)
MIDTREKVVTKISELNESQLRQVAEYVEFLQFREIPKSEQQVDDAELEKLYAEFADEDSKLAESDLDQYAENLTHEDAIR